MRTLHLRDPETIHTPSTLTRRCTLERWDSGRLVASQMLWYEMPALARWPEQEDAESFLLAALLPAMAEGRTLVVQGVVSKLLLSNLIEFRDAWHRWLPQQYARIDIYCDRIRDLPAADDEAGAVVAYSGGVDATFSVWRHATSQLSYRTQKIAACAIIHGFDIPLADERAFQSARDKAAETLKTMGIEIIPIRTNFREVLRHNWEHLHGAALVSCLQQLKGLVRVGILGSTEPYHALVLPWGSNPVTDHLLSSSSFTVLQDGAAFSRTQKIAALAAWPAACANLRVCWQGTFKDRNCGRCEKCLRTMFNFLANGLPIPPCFPSARAGPREVRRVALTSTFSQSEWREILAEAVNNNIRANWVRVLRFKLLRLRLSGYFHAIASRLRRLLPW